MFEVKLKKLLHEEQLRNTQCFGTSENGLATLPTVTATEAPYY